MLANATAYSVCTSTTPATAFKAPAIYSFVDALPKTPTGKVKRAELRTRGL